MNPSGSTPLHIDRHADGPPEDLKVQINNLLWATLAPSTTLDEADRLACSIVESIERTWNEWRAR